MRGAPPDRTVTRSALRTLAVLALVAATWAGLQGLAQAQTTAAPGKPLVVGSKRFTESYILGEIACQALTAAGRACAHRQGLGNTGILEQALAAGEVDLYPEYTGTVVRAILKREGNPSLAELNQWLAPRGLKAAVPLGFNNTYALAMPEAEAQRLGVAKISDLARLPAGSVRPGLSHEFIVRADGWPALARAYGLAFAAGNALDHGLAYDAVKGGRVNLIDAYSTDARLGRDGLRVLADDRAFFPRYDAVLLMRAGVDERALAALAPLAAQIDEARMIALNAEAELDGKPFAEVARGFLAGLRGPAATGPGSAGASSAGAVPPAVAMPAASSADAPTARGAGFFERLLAPDLGRLAGQHVVLVFVSVALAVAVGVPLGIVAWRRPRLAGLVLGAVGLLQTVPSLALLAFLIAAFGTIGFVPALVALFVYALLPIVANTLTGLRGVPAGLSLAAQALALSAPQRLRLVELPLALPTVIAGVKTAAVINVGTATVAAFVGAGGFGERVVAGLAVNDTAAMLAGALPAAALALLVQWAFEWAERRAVRHGASEGAGAGAGSVTRRWR